MLTVGAGVIMYHGGYKNTEYYPHFAFGLRSIAESMVTAMTLSITFMLLAPKCARIIGSNVGRLAMLTAIVTVASAAHEPPEYMPTQSDTWDPLQTSSSPHTFKATTMSHLQLPSMAEIPQRFEQLKTTYEAYSAVVNETLAPIAIVSPDSMANICVVPRTKFLINARRVTTKMECDTVGDDTQVIHISARRASQRWTSTANYSRSTCQIVTSYQVKRRS
jgi:hypothetical protein